MTDDINVGPSIRIPNLSTGLDVQHSVSMTYRFAAGEVIRAAVRQESGGNLAVREGPHSFMFAHWVGGPS